MIWHCHSYGDAEGSWLEAARSQQLTHPCAQAGTKLLACPTCRYETKVRKGKAAGSRPPLLMEAMVKKAELEPIRVPCDQPRPATGHKVGLNRELRQNDRP
jgi:hypothetical protein